MRKTQNSLLESHESHESHNQIFTSCTIMNSNAKSYDNQILNPYSMAQIEGSDNLQCCETVNSFVSIIKKDLFPEKCFTNRYISLQLADGNMTTVPTALIRIQSDFFSGVMEFAVLPHPVSPIIIGNMKHVTENFANRKFENNISQGAKQQIGQNNQKSEQLQKAEISPVANQQIVENKQTNEQTKIRN